MIKVNETLPIRTPQLQVGPDGALRDVSTDAARFAAQMEDMRRSMDNFPQDDSLLGQMRAEAAKEAAMPSPASVALAEAQLSEVRQELIAQDLQGPLDATQPAGSPTASPTHESSPPSGSPLAVPSAQPIAMAGSVAASAEMPLLKGNAGSVKAADLMRGEAQTAAREIGAAGPVTPSVAASTPQAAAAPAATAPAAAAAAPATAAPSALAPPSVKSGEPDKGAAPAAVASTPSSTPASIPTPAGSKGAPVQGNGISPEAEPALAPGQTSVGQASAGPVLTPSQLQARVLKRKALGLDGVQAALVQKQELAQNADRAAEVLGNEVAGRSSGGVGIVPPQVAQPQQPAQSVQPARSVQSVQSVQSPQKAIPASIEVARMPAVQAKPDATIAAPASTSGGGLPSSAQLAPQVKVSSQAMPQAMPSEKIPVGAQAVTQVDQPMAAKLAQEAPVIGNEVQADAAQTLFADVATQSSANPTSLAVAINAGPDAAAQAAPAAQPPELAQTDMDPFEAALEASTQHSVESPGALPAPVRAQREERIAEAIGAQLMAQQARLEVVNVPQLSEVIEKI